ncbi:hypothetical protein C8J56DRAFT_1046680 [Mycena floridula]|nr:hypothetical protein C8J56DRAFT_1046680 [Mycena floridula]
MSHVLCFVPSPSIFTLAVLSTDYQASLVVPGLSNVLYSQVILTLFVLRHFIAVSYSQVLTKSRSGGVLDLDQELNCVSRLRTMRMQIR